MRLLPVTAVLAGVLASASCAAPPVDAPAPRASDPLAERIFDTRDGTELDREQLLSRMLGADVVYLGEKHDADRHHAIQLELLQALAARGRRPALGLEMFPRSHTALLMGYVTWAPRPHLRAQAETAETWLREELGSEQGARRDFIMAAYGPQLALARERQWPLFGIDLPLSLRARISRVGVAGLTASERALLAPTGFDDPVYESLMRERIKAAHCGYGSPEYLGRLYDNWVARNDAMARAIVVALADAQDGPVVVVVGAGHTEHGMGVPERVSALRPGTEQVDLGLTELADRPQPVSGYTARVSHQGRDFGPAHRYLWFTEPAAEPVDHCAAFREAMDGDEG